MLESWRLAYLNALEIPQFIARGEIDGAPRLPELSSEQIWAEPEFVSEPVAEIEAEAVQPAIATLVELEPESKQQVAKPENTETPVLDLAKLGFAKEVSEPKKIQKKQLEAARFSLAIVTVPEEMRIIVQLGVFDSPGLSAVEHRMLSDLLQALGYPQSLNQSAPQTFQWPLVNNPQIAKDRAAARDGLLGFFASSPALPKNVFLGASAASILNEGELDPITSVIEPVSLSGFPGESLVLPNFAQMQDWNVKARSWRQLQLFLS